MRVAHKGHRQPWAGCHHIHDGPEVSVSLGSMDILLATGITFWRKTSAYLSQGVRQQTKYQLTTGTSLIWAHTVVSLLGILGCGEWKVSSLTSLVQSTHLQFHSCPWLPLQDRCLGWLPHNLEIAVKWATVASGYQKYNYKPGKMNHCHLMEISRLNGLANKNWTWMPPLDRVKGKGCMRRWATCHLKYLFLMYTMISKILQEFLSSSFSSSSASLSPPTLPMLGDSKHPTMYMTALLPMEFWVILQ